MYDNEIKTIKDLFYYQYSKVIAKIVYKLDDGKEVMHRHYGLIKSTYRAYKHSDKSWEDIIREHIPLQETENNCAYCGKNGHQQKLEHLIPESFNLKPECSTCGKIHSGLNQVFMCTDCSTAKGSLGLYEYYRKLIPDILWFYDYIPKLIEKKYLENIYYCHECVGTLDKEDLDGDGKLTVMDIDYILRMK